MKHKIISWVFFLSAILIFLFAFIVDLILDKDFSLGYIQIALLIVSFILTISGYFLVREIFELKSILFGLLFLLFVTGFGFIKFLSFQNHDDLRTWHDTYSYVTISEKPFFDTQFWNASRPFFLPLVYKLLNITSENINLQNALLRISLFQYIFSFISWILLSYSIFRYFNSYWQKILSTTVIFGLGLGLHSTIWDRLILSESISNNLFILCLALFLFLNHKNNDKDYIFINIFLILAICCYVFIKDANASMVLLISLCGLLSLFCKKRIGKHFFRRNFWIIAAIVFSSVSLYQMNKTNRWVEPLYHVLANRGLDNKNIKQFFFLRDLDLSDLSNPEKYSFASRDTVETYSTEEISFLKSARNLYTRYLIFHPRYTFCQIKNFESIINPINYGYLHSPNLIKSWEFWITDFFYPISSTIYFLCLFFCVIIFFMDRFNFTIQSIFPATLLLVIFPLSVMVWHADTFEIERHAEQFMIQSRVAFWISLLFLIDKISIKMMNYKK